MDGPHQHTLPLDRLLAGQKRALELAVAGAALGDVLDALALALEDVVDRRLLAAVLLLDGSGRHLRHGAAPSLPGEYNRSMDGIAVGPATGSCGMAASTRRRVIAEDIQTDPHWREYRGLAAAHGLRSCWSMPILSSTGAVLGTFATYARVPHRPGAAELDAVQLLTHTAALVIERERSQAALATTNERYRLVAEAADDAIWDWDLANDEVVWSPGLRKHYGHALPDAKVGPSWWFSHIHPGDVARVQAGFRNALLRGDEFWEEEYRFARADGAHAVVLDRGRIVRAPSGRPTRVVGAMINVTERRRVQARDRFLVQLDDALRPLVAPDEITGTAAAILGEHLRVHRCAYAEVEDDQDTFFVTGNYTNGVASIVGRHRFGQFGDECLRLMRGGAPYVVTDSESDRRTADVREAYRATAIRAVICVPVSKDGRLAGAMAVHAGEPRAWRRHEVELVQQVASRCWESIERGRLTRTLREAVEREQRAREEADTERQRAESANRSKDEFLAMLGHELRNPLSPIRTALQLMKLRDSGAVQRERTVIERQVEHLTRLVDDLLDVSRIVRGRVDLHLEAVDLADIVARAVELASPLLEERSHRLAIELPPEPLTLSGDATRLVQVLANLLTNAAKYTDPAGDIAVRACREGDEVTVDVADTGRGISAETLPHVFELFTQERQGSDRAQGGLGLGLAIVRSLVELHGGRIEAQSDGAARGSVFTLRLPIGNVPTAATGARDVDVAAPACERRHVLVVDDNEDGAAMLAAVLGARGHVVRVAHDGPTALEIAREFRPEIALLDIGLPVMDGYELAVKMRRQPGLELVTLVAVTGYGQSTDKARSRAAGFNQHLVKPIDLDAIDQVLR